MHILRAENNITDKEIGLRAFFTANKSEFLDDWEKIMERLQTIKVAGDDWSECPTHLGAIKSLRAILETYPNLYWKMLLDCYDIEHILPREWNNYDGWTQEAYEKHLNLLGNILPLERAKNIKAQNEYLRKKKMFYSGSVVADALEMIDVPDNGWTPQAVKNKHHEKVNRLSAFLGLEEMAKFI